MKTQKIISLKTVLSLSLVLALLTGACAQSGKGSDVRAENQSATESTVKKPEMDLQSAILSGNLEVVKQHIEAGTDINAKDAMSGSTPLITATTFDKREIAKALIGVVSSTPGRPSPDIQCHNSTPEGLWGREARVRPSGWNANIATALPTGIVGVGRT